MMRKVVMTWLLGMIASNALAATDCPVTGRNVEWAAQCFEMKDDKRQVKPAFIKQIKVNRYGMATIMITDPRELVAVDRHGKVVISNIRHTGEFDYPTAEKGVGRFYAMVRNTAGERKEQCGYFKDVSFRIVVPAQYDDCDPFRNGEAMVCTDCVTYCSDSDCHSTTSIGGRGAVLGIDGKVRKTFVLKDADNFCLPPWTLRTGKYNGGKTWLSCTKGLEMPGTGFPGEP